MKFKEKVQSMTIQEIIMAMVEGLRTPKVKVDMGTYGVTRIKPSFLGLFPKPICVGCAATNAIFQIAGITPKPYEVDSSSGRSALLCGSLIDEEVSFLECFELAIDCLRKGRIDMYNYDAEKLGIATIKVMTPLPALYNSYTESELLKYVDLANAQPVN